MITMAVHGSVLPGLGRIANTMFENYLTQANMREQARLNQQAIDKQNEYNSPQSQMQRFQQAGLNPDLIYGQSNEGYSGNVSTDAPPSPHGDPVQAVINQRLAESQIAVNDSVVTKNLADAGYHDAGADYFKRKVQAQDIVDELNRANAGRLRKDTERMDTDIENMRKQGEILSEDLVRKKMENEHYEERLKAELDKMASDMRLNEAQANKFKADAWKIYKQTPAEIAELNARAAKEGALTSYYKASTDAMAKCVWEALAYRDGLKVDEDGHYVAKDGSAVVMSYVDAGADKATKYVGRIAGIVKSFVAKGADVEPNDVHETWSQTTGPSGKSTTHTVSRTRPSKE